MRRPISLVLCAFVTLLVLGGCTPARVGVRVGDDFFSPATTTANRGATVRWTNDGFRRHTTTGNAPLALWHASLNRGAQFDFTFVAAGTYAYHCTLHAGMSGTVRVPISVTPASGSTATTFTVSLASRAAPSGFEYVVQKRDPGGSFQTFRTLTAATTTFRPTRQGAYQFRAQLKRTGSSAASGFSDPKGITVG
jgi:hypothetical protein